MDSNLQKKAYFQSRRGLQELDLIFIPFVQEVFCSLDQEDQKAFLTLLDNEDIDLIDWLLKEVTPPAEFFEIVNKVKRILPNFNLSVTMGNDENPNNPINIENLRELIDKGIKFVKIGFFNKKFINVMKNILLINVKQAV